eukprot:11897619-Prorocentrum_lima.AAC.1
MSSGFQRRLAEDQRRHEKEERLLEQMVEGEVVDHEGKTPWAPATPSDADRERHEKSHVPIGTV